MPVCLYSCEPLSLFVRGRSGECRCAHHHRPKRWHTCRCDSACRHDPHGAAGMFQTGHADLGGVPFDSRCLWQPRWKRGQRGGCGGATVRAGQTACCGGNRVAWHGAASHDLPSPWHLRTWARPFVQGTRATLRAEMCCGCNVHVGGRGKESARESARTRARESHAQRERHTHTHTHTHTQRERERERESERAPERDTGRCR